MNLDKYKVQFLIETVEAKELSDVEYFSTDYKQYVSNSKLKLINPDEGGNPQKFKDGIKSEYNASFEFGTAVHELILQPEEFVLSEYPFKPSAKLGLFIDEVIKSRNNGLSISNSLLVASIKADYYKGKLSPKIIKTAIQKGLRYYYDSVFKDIHLDEFGREVIILNEKLQKDVKECINCVHQNIKIRNLLHDQNFTETIQHFNEQALFIDIAVTLPNEEIVVIPFKLKFDNYSIDPEIKVITLNDLKTTGKPVSYFMGNMIPTLDDKGKKTGEQWCNGSMQNYHYYRQMGIYMMILQIYMKSKGYTDYSYKSNMMVVESTPDFKSEVFPVSQSYIKKGLQEFKELICRVAWHEYHGYDKELNENE